MKLQGLTPERPLTHDLFVTMLERLDVRVDRVVISDLADETYHARLLLVAATADHEIDARPSDALALAVRTGAPIFATTDVLDRAATVAGRRRRRRARASEGARPDGDRARGTGEPIDASRGSTSSASSSTRSTSTRRAGAAAPS